MKHIVRILIITIAMLIATAAWANKPVFQQIKDKVKQAAAAKATKPTPPATTPAVAKPKAPVVKKPVFVKLREFVKNKK